MTAVIYLQQLYVCLFYCNRIQLSHHIWHHSELAPHNVQLSFQHFDLESDFCMIIVTVTVTQLCYREVIDGHRY